MNYLLIFVIVSLVLLYNNTGSTNNNFLVFILLTALAYILIQRKEEFTETQQDIAGKILVKFQDIIANNKLPVDYIYFLDSISNPYLELASIDVFNDFVAQAKNGSLTKDYILSKLK